MKSRITIALAGNPNSGKTTLFNIITGSRQHVGNYPGVTVEKKEGRCRHDDTEINVVDLPGTYSLTAYSIEEVVARNFIIDEKPLMSLSMSSTCLIWNGICTSASSFSNLACRLSSLST